MSTTDLENLYLAGYTYRKEHGISHWCIHLYRQPNLPLCNILKAIVPMMLTYSTFMKTVWSLQSECLLY